jgi:GNAT superfamily N-acetyltransferase
MTLPGLDSKPIPSHLNLTWEQIARKADQHTLAAQLWLDTRAPGAAQFYGEGVSCGSTGIPAPLLNQALGAHFPEEFSGNQVRNEIEGIQAFFSERGVPWYWWLSPFCQPSNMPELLADYGLVERDSSLPAMVAFLEPETWREPAPEITVWRAKTQEDLQAASHIRRVGFRFPEGIGLDYFELMPDSWLSEESPARLYLAGVGDGPPVSMGALIYTEGLPGVYVMATLPEWSRRGLGTAILHKIMTEAAAGEGDFIILTASPFGFGLYQKFGFEHVFDYHIYQLETQVNK